MSADKPAETKISHRITRMKNIMDPSCPIICAIKRTENTFIAFFPPNDQGQAPPANDAAREAELTAPSGVACTLWLGDVSFILSYIVDLMALCQ